MILFALLATAAVIAVAVGFYAHTRPVVPMKPDAGSHEPEVEAEPDPLEGLSDEEVLVVAPKLALCRAPKPWARVEVEIQIAGPDREMRLRQRIWERFAQRGEPGEVVIGWHHGSRLQLRLGNELSQSLFVLGTFEPNEFAFLERRLRPGMVFVDAGAHEGTYSLFAALKVGAEGRVLAIEPSDREKAAWKANMELNGCGAVLVDCAVGEADGEGELIVAQDHRSGHNTLGAFVWENVQEARRRKVVVRSLDSLMEEHGLERVDVLKLDIEGAETKALRGGAHLFRQMRPAVVVEVSPRSLEEQGSSREELLAAFEAYGYAMYCFDYKTGRLVPGTENAGGENLIALPAERVGEWMEA